MAPPEASTSYLPVKVASNGDPLDRSLTQVVHNMVDAVNARSFEATAYPWTYLSDDFTAELFFAGWEKNVSGRDDFMEYFTNYTKAHPEYYVRIVDVVVSITKTTGRATIFSNFETNGIPPGILRSTVGAWEFGPIGDGQWRCVNYRCVPGINPGAEAAASRV